MEAVLDANLHLDRVVGILRRHDVRIHPNVPLLDHICQAAEDGDSDKVPQLDIDPMIALVHLFHVLELKVQCCAGP